MPVPLQMSVLFMSLAGLLVLNSNKHRAMRKRLEEMRLQRNGAMPATRSDEFPDGPPSEKPWMAYLVLGTMTIIILCKIYLFFWGVMPAQQASRSGRLWRLLRAGSKPRVNASAVQS
ncbi:hypothetical protein PPS11_04355 [Pseudomonas putida S11]|nr:hypothetical protein PPS11_04355 [Pseudomonas putida S11]